MIIQEQIGNDLVKTYSDKGMMIRKKGTDELYSEAIDPQKFNREYEETDIRIDNNDTDYNDNEKRIFPYIKVSKNCHGKEN